MVEVASFDLPESSNDDNLGEKIEKIVVGKMYCRSFIMDSIRKLQLGEASICEGIVDSYPSSANYNSYYR